MWSLQTKKETNSYKVKVLGFALVYTKWLEYKRLVIDLKISEIDFPEFDSS